MKIITIKRKLNNAALVTLLFVVCLMLPSCFLFGDKGDEPKSKSRSEVPAVLAKKWMAGQFSVPKFWQHTDSVLGSANEIGIAFDFKTNGEAAFYFVTGGITAGCYNKALIYKKGTVQFNTNSFTFYPEEGKKRGIFRGCGATRKNYEVKATGKDLEPETYYYSIQKNSQGQEQLVTRFEENATSATSFQTVNW